MKDITVQEFINTYNKKESDQEKQDYIESMVKIEYMPINTKMTLAEKIVENAYWKDVEKKDIVSVSSPVRHVLHLFHIMLTVLSVRYILTRILLKFTVRFRN